MERRREYYGSRLIYTEGDLATLLGDVRDFADVWQKRQAQDVMIQAGPTHMAVKEDAAARESELQLLADAKGAGHLNESDAAANSALISVMVRSVMADTSDDTPAHRFYPVVQDPPASSSDGRMPELVRLAIKILPTAEDRSEAQLIAALRRAPAGCPSDARHQFWLRGACDFPSCKYQHMQGRTNFLRDPPRAQRSCMEWRGQQRYRGTGVPCIPSFGCKDFYPC